MDVSAVGVEVLPSVMLFVLRGRAPRQAVSGASDSDLRDLGACGRSHVALMYEAAVKVR